LPSFLAGPGRRAACTSIAFQDLRSEAIQQSCRVESELPGNECLFKERTRNKSSDGALELHMSRNLPDADNAGIGSHVLSLADGSMQ
jgi:hypothetical protein